MAGQKKKMAAALAAVSLYLQQEEAMVAGQEPQVSLKKPESFEFSEWGRSGRQEMMAMRKLIQLRALRRF